MKKRGMDWDAPFWKVLDLDLGELIPHVIEADDETGEYVVRVYDSDGFPVRGADGGIEFRRMTGRIRLVHDDMSNYAGISQQKE
jgi:hypothetical protein